MSSERYKLCFKLDYTADEAQPRRGLRLNLRDFIALRARSPIRGAPPADSLQPHQDRPRPAWYCENFKCRICACLRVLLFVRSWAFKCPQPPPKVKFIEDELRGMFSLQEH
jgi:hypothetical protein